MTRGLAVVGIVTTLAAAVLVGVLHVIPPSAHLSPTRRTISEYALLETGWVFDLAVLALAVGAAATLLALAGARLVPVNSASAVGLLVFSVSLAMVVLFPKHNWAVGPSATGDIHRLASLVAFLSLPAATLLGARAWLRPARWRAHASWSTALGVLSLLCFAPIGIAIALQPVTGVRWWRAIPLGAVERALAICEVATVLALAWWAARAAGRRAPQR
jgi:Protein of unknown function (DUF998)